MRIVLVLSAFPKVSETFIVSKFLGLLERGLDVFVVCSRFESSNWKSFQELMDKPDLRKRIKPQLPHHKKWFVICLLPFALLRSILRRPIRTLGYLYAGWKKIGFNVFRRFYLDEQILRLNADILHFEFGPLAVDRLYIRDLLDSKIVVSFRGYDLNYVGLDTTNYYREVWRKADAIHLLGAGLWQKAQMRGCPPDKPHVLISPAVDSTFFQPQAGVPAMIAGTEARPLRILSVGRLEWVKGYEYALDAIHLLREQGVHCIFRIVGDGSYLEPLAFLRQELGLDEIVEFLGSKSRLEVKAQMVWADVLLHSAVSEGFCNAVVEAQAMGLPIVCSDPDGLRENVSNGETGYVVPSRRPDALAEKLAFLGRNPEIRTRMGEAGRKRVLSLYQLSSQISAFADLYRNLIKPHTACPEDNMGHSALKNNPNGMTAKG